MPVPAAIRDDLKKYFRDFSIPQQVAVPTCKTGMEQLDGLTGGLPRGAMSEIFGAPSSGRTSLMYSILAEATRNREYCALVDTHDTFDPTTAAAGIALEQLLWIRCDGILENSIKVTDLLIQGGGFGIVILDMADVPPAQIRKLPLSYWFRFRRAVENTPTAFVMIQREPFVKACTSLALDVRRSGTQWSGSHQDFRLLRGADLEVGIRKPARVERARSQARVSIAG